MEFWSSLFVALPDLSVRPPLILLSVFPSSREGPTLHLTTGRANRHLQFFFELLGLTLLIEDTEGLVTIPIVRLCTFLTSPMFPAWNPLILMALGNLVLFSPLCGMSHGQLLPSIAKEV